jgi:hypothetical protein
MRSNNNGSIDIHDYINVRLMYKFCKIIKDGRCKIDWLLQNYDECSVKTIL